MMIHTLVDSPIGVLLLGGDGETLSPAGDGRPRAGARPTARRRRRFAGARTQLAEYFAGSRTAFDAAAGARAGASFELRVWSALQEIPYGETESYGALARRIGAPDAARAVGLANGRNPIAIVIPCHRVIGSDGSLTGFGGGLPRKRFLLDLEAGVGSLLAPG